MSIAIGAAISCLDHGYVRLVDAMGDDLSIVRSARVSFNAAWRTGQDKGSDERLISYLWKHKHTTPFEAVTFTFEVKAPIFVVRQWHRHRTWTFNEVSARYTEVKEEYYVPSADKIGEVHPSNKQSRVIDPNMLETIDMLLPSMIDHSCAAAFEAYRTLLGRGVPREVARMVLPMSTYTSMFATVNLLNLLKFIGLRDTEEAQYEISVYAAALRELIQLIVPVTMKAFEGK